MNPQSEKTVIHRKSAILVIAIILLCFTSSSVQSDQVVPDVYVECEDNIDSIDSSPIHPTRSTFFECLVENPSSFTEEIELQYGQSGLDIIGPTTIILGPGSSDTVQVQARATVHKEAGQYDSYVTAIVNRVAGVQTGVLAPSDSDDFSLSVDSYTTCDVYDTPEFVDIGADRSMEFDVVLDCSSNEGVVVTTRFVMIEFGKVDPQNPDPVYWPDGFDDESPVCEIETTIGFSTHQCTFVATSDSSSLSSLEICLAMHLEGDEPPVFCSSNPINVEKSLLGFSSNGSLGILVPLLAVAAIALAALTLWRRARANPD
jgi:hypothetical protein